MSSMCRLVAASRAASASFFGSPVPRGLAGARCCAAFCFTSYRGALLTAYRFAREHFTPSYSFPTQYFDP
eukprot:6945484-Prymnesium_polylepis.1